MELYTYLGRYLPDGEQSDPEASLAGGFDQLPDARNESILMAHWPASLIWKRRPQDSLMHAIPFQRLIGQLDSLSARCGMH